MDARFRILHLTDFHWAEDTEEDQKLVVKHLLADLEPFAAQRKIDVLVFSGDLVARGQNAADFLAAKKSLLDPVRDALGLEDRSILICPGNHDVDRTVATKPSYIEAGLTAELTDTDRLNSHIDKHIDLPLEQDLSCARMANYFSFARRFYNFDPVIETSYFGCVVRRSPLGDVGFAYINSAWRSTGIGETRAPPFACCRTCN